MLKKRNRKNLTHCKKGHELNEENTYVTPNGGKRSCKICAKKWREKTSDITKNRRLLQTYGITLDSYNLMFAQQNSCCKICGKHQLELNKNLYVDHCHETNIVRGLLCVKCNAMIGHAKDSIVILKSAIMYLKNNISYNEYM